MDFNLIGKDAVAALLAAAWNVRDHGLLVGSGTLVGACALDSKGMQHVGCNAQHRFRSHDIHAEVAAIAALVSSGATRLLAIAVVAQDVSFTPCGACMDWIMEMGGGDAIVVTQSDRSGDVSSWSAAELMPHYPRR